MLEPNFVILYVSNPAASGAFYQNILGMSPKEASPAFQMFLFSNGMGLGLKEKQNVQPPATGNGGGELAFSATNDTELETLFERWSQMGITIAQEPIRLPYGYTFMGLDPDGNRLRVVSLGQTK